MTSSVVGQNSLGDGASGFVLQPRFTHFQIETAEFVPGEVVENAGGVGEFVLVEGRGDLIGDRCQTAENPLVFDRESRRVEESTGRRMGGGLVSVQVD